MNKLIYIPLICMFLVIYSTVNAYRTKYIRAGGAVGVAATTTTTVSAGSIGTTVNDGTSGFFPGQDLYINGIFTAIAQGTVQYGHILVTTAGGDETICLSLMNGDGSTVYLSGSKAIGEITDPPAWVNIDMGSSYNLDGSNYTLGMTVDGSSVFTAYDSGVGECEYDDNAGHSCGDVAGCTFPDIDCSNKSNTWAMTIYFDNNAGDPS